MLLVILKRLALANALSNEYHFFKSPGVSLLFVINGESLLKLDSKTDTYYFDLTSVICPPVLWKLCYGSRPPDTKQYADTNFRKKIAAFVTPPRLSKQNITGPYTAYFCNQTYFHDC
jgi:hypothetical protein